MKKISKGLLHLIIAAVAVINLIFLFLFQYGLSSATPAVQAAERAAEERAAYDAATGFGTSDIGTEKSAAIVTGIPEGMEEEAGIPVEETSSNVVTESEVPLAETETTVTASETEESSATTEEPEEPEVSKEPEPAADKAPVITLSSSLPTVTFDDLAKISSVFHDLGALSADDGYGKDISDQITTEYEATSDDSLEYHIVFSVTNQAGKTASTECTITVQIGDHPVLELTSDKVTLAQYEEFNYLRYVQTALDIDGSTLYDLISLSGYVDTDTPGTYEVTYSTISQVNFERIDKALTVVVE